MQVSFTINSCSQCPHVDMQTNFMDYTMTNWFCNKANKQIVSAKTAEKPKIPVWCPFNDKPKTTYPDILYKLEKHIKERILEGSWTLLQNPKNPDRFIIKTDSDWRKQPTYYLLDKNGKVLEALDLNEFKQVIIINLSERS